MVCCLHALFCGPGLRKHACHGLAWSALQRASRFGCGGSRLRVEGLRIQESRDRGGRRAVRTTAGSPPPAIPGPGSVDGSGYGSADRRFSSSSRFNTCDTHSHASVRHTHASVRHTYASVRHTQASVRHTHASVRHTQASDNSPPAATHRPARALRDLRCMVWVPVSRFQGGRGGLEAHNLGLIKDVPGMYSV